ncbi:MAG TPA: acyl-CoA dehydrogenase family protein [Acidimicrobiales bacterium]|nr:acyl-CoA dehydrogenase family protein [Acidimicrobiales bacterium]
MDLEFTEDQEELRGSVRSFLEKECPPALVRAVVETGEPPEKLWSAMVSLDWPALAIPEEYGGIGLSFVETAVVVEELGRVVAPGPLLATATQFAPLVLHVGTPEQGQHFLVQVASGAITGTLALADDPQNWGLADVTTRAERADGGWVLNGTKHGLLADPDTDEVAVVARVGDGIGAFIVPGALAGLQPMHSLDASRPLFTATLDGVQVPADRALGDPGSQASARGIARAVEEATLAMALETVGTSEALFRMVLAYVKDRQQFSVPIGSFQAVKHKMTDMFVAIERARALCYYAVAAIEEDAGSRASAVAMAKAASDDCQRLVCQESFQSFGGIGYTWEHDSHMFIKRAKTTGVLFGGAKIHSQFLADQLGVTTAP